MVANQKFSRIDILELKALIFQKIGHKRAGKYFDLLKRLFSFKLGKYEFDKVCVRTIGRDNLILHNQLIRSILNNSCLGKGPPLRVKKAGGRLNDKVANGHQRIILHAIYGEGLPSSPRKRRSPVNKDRKFQDRPSPLGPLVTSPIITREEPLMWTQEQQSATELHSLGSRPPFEVASVEDGEEVEQAAGSPSIQSQSPVTAPLGITMNIGGGARKMLYSGSLYNFYPLSCQRSYELPDTISLRNRLEQLLDREGLNLSVDCANVLNNGLDCYLKRLMEPCLRLAGSRCRRKHVQEVTGQSIAVSNELISGSESYEQRPANFPCASVLDFCFAMRSNPCILGGDWPMQLEKLCGHAFGINEPIFKYNQQF